ncbi:MAG: homoserine dehydrogenase [Clostridia bacterium]|nr:homoserine dehydrogenase [Clostridia bacterium]
MQIAVMGFGTVGSGVAELVTNNSALLARRCGVDSIEVKRILDIRDFPGSPFEDKLTKNFEDIVSDPEISVVAETMGGLRPAFEFTAACLKAGKHVVTSNKELVAAKGDELLKLARENSVSYLFEASVGGGIPLLRPISRCLAGNEFLEITGILNGTTNFILTKMITENMPFGEALSIAQKNGYAERDPSADIDGADACRKTAILASLACGKHVDPDLIHTEGIRDLNLEDVRYAHAAKFAVKLLGTCRKKRDGSFYTIVRPALVPFTSLLSRVDGVFNAVMVRGDAVGVTMFYGRGAGKMPTASAVVGDIADCVCLGRNTKTGYGWGDRDGSVVSDYLSEPVSLYVRGLATDRAAAYDELLEVFGSNRYIYVGDAPINEIAFITQRDSERTLRQKLGTLRNFSVKSVIRVEDDI